MNISGKLDNISAFYQTLIDNNYDFIFFENLNKKNGQVIIRHDIDFEIEAAYEMAKIENEMGIKTTYFFLISNDSYNIFSKKNYENVIKIKNLGHQISIHFDPTIYSDFESGFKMEKQIFELLFNLNISITSLHRPNDFFLDFNSKIAECDHTYMNKYTNDIKYFSDSKGLFRYGHPLESKEFLNNKSLQILIHPIWWIYNGADRYKKLINFYNSKNNSLKEHYSKNCIPFKKILNEIR